MNDELVKGSYVLATKYTDGDPGDHFCVGFYDGLLDELYDSESKRHLVINGKGEQFRNNGFRRVARISTRRGEWIVKHFALIESQDKISVWHWYRAPWRELNEC